MRVLGKWLIAAASVGLCVAAGSLTFAAPSIASEGKAPRTARVSPATNQSGAAGLDLVVLIDQTLSQRVDVQLKEIGDFLQTVPAETRVAVAYADYGGIRYAQDFTTDHVKAAKAIHIPSSFPGAANGLYDSVSDLIKKWPASQNRKVVLLISDGIDVTDGSADVNPDENPVFQHALHQAEQSGVTVDSIYASGSGRGVDNRFLVLNGQGCLLQLASKTGGLAFFQGLDTPISFAPYLKDIAKSLSAR
jgi:hypothetical protein